MSDVVIDQHDSGEVLRSLSDSDLQIILSNAIREESFSPLDFLNCNDADLARLGEMAEVEMNKVPASQWQELRNRTMLFTAITVERAKRGQRESTLLSERIVSLNNQIDTQEQLLDSLLVRGEVGIATLDRTITGARQSILNAGVGIANAERVLDSGDVN